MRERRERKGSIYHICKYVNNTYFLRHHAREKKDENNLPIHRQIIGQSWIELDESCEQAGPLREADEIEKSELVPKGGDYSDPRIFHGSAFRNPKGGGYCSPGFSVPKSDS